MAQVCEDDLSDFSSISQSGCDDSRRSSTAAGLEDSRASTAASCADLPRESRSKQKLPVDFSFLTNVDTAPVEPPQKARRIQNAAAVEIPTSGRHLKVVGPESIQTLRGRLFEKEVALILCGEAHEDAIDLTRSKSIVEPVLGWIMMPSLASGAGFDPKEAMATKIDITLQEAKKWAKRLFDEESDDDHDILGATLVFASLGRTKGSAAVFRPSVKRDKEFPLPPGAAVMELRDTDDQAREFKARQLDTKVAPVTTEEQDALIAERKVARLAEGMELFDDWLIRQAASANVHVEFVQEAPVSAQQVELHIEPGISAAPPANETLRCMDLDSDEDEPESKNPGGGYYLDYLRRRSEANLPPERVHGVDCRVLGDAEDDALPRESQGSFQVPRFQVPSERDREVAELEDAGAEWAKVSGERLGQDMYGIESAPLPSWESFLGGPADLLYHVPHIKADYSTFLADCVKTPEKLWRFFEALYFQTVPEALAEIRVDEKTRPSACARSLAYQAPSPETPLMRRPMGHCSDRRRPVPVRAAPMDRYLKARGFREPRTWLSGVAEQLRRSGGGGEELVAAAKTFYREVVGSMLADPRDGDLLGDNFVAFLRACHRDIYTDIDTTEPCKLLKQEFAESKKDVNHKYNLKDIRIPGLEEAFAEIAEPRPPGQASSARQQILSKIMIDAFALRSVDVAMILKIGNIVSAAPSTAPVVVVLYAGADHTDSVAKFWRSIGFSPTGLPKGGAVVNKRADEDDAPKCLVLPSYLYDLGQLFPVPASLKEAMPRNTVGGKLHKLKRLRKKTAPVEAEAP